MIKFEWDEAKNKLNWRKHQIWFEEASQIFNDPQGILFDDPEHSHKEDRFLLLGMDPGGRILIVVHCYRDPENVVRIISARKATKRERRHYEEGI